METTVFLANVKKGFPINDATVMSQVGVTYFKVALLSYGSTGVFTDSIAQCVRGLWSFIPRSWLSRT